MECNRFHSKCFNRRRLIALGTFLGINNSDRIQNQSPPKVYYIIYRNSTIT